MKQSEMMQAMQTLLNEYEEILTMMNQKWEYYPAGCLSSSQRENKTYYRYEYRNGKKVHQIAISLETVEGAQVMRELQEKNLVYHARPILRQNIKALRIALQKLTPYDPVGQMSNTAARAAGHAASHTAARAAAQTFAGQQPYTPGAPIFSVPNDFLLPGQTNPARWIADTRAGSFPANPFKREKRTIGTNDGHKVRSKSERDWCDALAAIPVWYRYECGLFLRGGSGGTVVYPDFTILHPRENRLLYVEHFGFMDKPDYAIRQLEKLQAYAQNGILPGRDLFFTTETKDRPLTKQQIGHAIRQMNILQEESPCEF